MSILVVDAIRNRIDGRAVTVGDSESGEFINFGASTMIDGAMLGSNKRHISLSMTTENVPLESDSEHAMVSLHIPYNFTLTKVKIGLSAVNGNVGDGNPGDGNMVVTFTGIDGLTSLTILQGSPGFITSSADLNIPLMVGNIITADLNLAQPFIGGSGMKLYLIGNVT